MGWMDDTPLLAKNTVWVDNQYSLLQDQIYHRFLHSRVQCRVVALRGELSWRTSPGAWGKSPAGYWAASLLVLHGPIDLGCMTALLQEPYFPPFNTISLESFCIGLQSFEVFGARIISSFKFETYSGWVSVPQFLLSWSLIAAMQIINKRTGCKKPQELQSSEWYITKQDSLSLGLTPWSIRVLRFTISDAMDQNIPYNKMKTFPKYRTVL